MITYAFQHPSYSIQGMVLYTGNFYHKIPVQLSPAHFCCCAAAVLFFFLLEKKLPTTYLVLYEGSVSGTIYLSPMP